MSTSTINYNKFEVFSMDASLFWKEYQRTDLKCHDRDACFGAKYYDYFVYLSKEEVERKGSSKLYVLIQTNKSLKKMKKEIKDKIRTVMRDHYNLDLDEIEEKRRVIVACDRLSGSAIGLNNASIFFNTKERRDK